MTKKLVVAVFMFAVTDQPSPGDIEIVMRETPAVLAPRGEAAA